MVIQVWRKKQETVVEEGYWKTAGKGPLKPIWGQFSSKNDLSLSVITATPNVIHHLDSRQHYLMEIIH